MPVPKATTAACLAAVSVLPPPFRMKDGSLRFAECMSEFAPNLTPEEVLRFGSFGGGYFRRIESKVTGKVHDRVWDELPREWLDGLDISTQVAADTYRKDVNRYGVRCGVTMGKSDEFGLLAWEDKDWIVEQDPYGWFQWYCRFFLGRRTEDDHRQILRWLGICGPKGRWKNNLVAQCVKAGKTFDDETVSPVVRQTLQHWAYRLTQSDFEVYASKVRAGAKTAFIPGGIVRAPSGLATASEQQRETSDGATGGTRVSTAPAKKTKARRQAAPYNADEVASPQEHQGEQTARKRQKRRFVQAESRTRE